MAGPRRAWTEDDVREAVKRSTSWRQVSTTLGLSHGGQSYKKVQECAVAVGLDTSHFRGQGWSKGTGSGRNMELNRAAQRRWYDRNKSVYYENNKRRRRERLK